jgi:L-threonylcarbamoyladenylate synthase
MKKIRNNYFKQLFWEDLTPKQIADIAHLLKNNNVGICSTDTIYGFLAQPSQNTYDAIGALKGEGRTGKPCITLVGSPNKVNHFADMSTLSTNQKNLISSAMPGPVTFIVPAHSSLPKYMTSDQSTIALRCPNHAGLQKILTHFNGLFSTSANTSGAKPPHAFDDIEQHLVDAVSFCIQNNDTSLDKATSSTILDCSSPGHVTVVRAGAYPIDTLESLYGGVFNE